MSRNNGVTGSVNRNFNPIDFAIPILPPFTDIAPSIQNFAFTVIDDVIGIQFDILPTLVSPLISLIFDRRGRFGCNIQHNAVNSSYFVDDPSGDA